MIRVILDLKLIILIIKFFIDGNFCFAGSSFCINFVNKHYLINLFRILQISFKIIIIYFQSARSTIWMTLFAIILSLKCPVPSSPGYIDAATKKLY